MNSQLKPLFKTMILSNPLCFPTPWKCICDIFANNNIDYNFDHNKFSHSYVIDNDLRINKSRLKIMENELSKTKIDIELNTINYYHAVFICDFIEENIETILSSNAISFQDKCTADFNISDKSNLWLISVNHPTEIIVAATSFAQEASQLLWSNQMNNGIPMDINAWRCKKDYSLYIKLKEFKMKLLENQ